MNRFFLFLSMIAIGLYCYDQQTAREQERKADIERFQRSYQGI